MKNPFFNLLNDEQKNAVIKDMKINPDIKGEYAEFLEEKGEEVPYYGSVVPDNEWLEDFIDHQNWEGEYVNFDLSDEGQRKHYFNDVFREENVSFDEELLNSSIKAVKKDINKKDYTNEIIEKMRRAGIDVITDKNEFDWTLRHLEEINITLEMLEEDNNVIQKDEKKEIEDLSTSKNDMESWSQSLNKKIIIDSSNSQDIISNLNQLKSIDTKIKGEDFLTSLKQSFYLDEKIDSNYVHEKNNNIELRLSNHCAISEKSKDYDESTSIVIKLVRGKNAPRFRKSPKADVIEFVYYPENLTIESEKAIINGLIDWVKTGEYTYKQSDEFHQSTRKEFIEKHKKLQKMTSTEYNNKEVDAFVTDKSGFVDPEKIAAIDLYGFEKAKKMWENGEPDWETRMMLQDKSISDYLSQKKPNIYKKQIDDTVYGFVHNGKIYMNPEIMNSNAAVHEYTHLWDAYTEKTNPKLWNKGLEIFKDTKYWYEVKSDPNYQDIKDDDNLVLSEIHSRISGEIAETAINRIAELDGEKVKMDAIDWNTEVWLYSCDKLLGKDNIVDINDKEKMKYLAEFLITPMKDLFSEKNINTNEELSWNKIEDFFEGNIKPYQASFDTTKSEVLVEGFENEKLEKEETVCRMLMDNLEWSKYKYDGKDTDNDMVAKQVLEEKWSFAEEIAESVVNGKVRSFESAQINLNDKMLNSDLYKNVSEIITEKEKKQIEMDQNLISSLSTKDYENIQILNNGFEYSSIMISDDLSLLSYAKLKEIITKDYSENNFVLGKENYENLNFANNINLLDDYYQTSSLIDEMNKDEDFKIKVFDMIFESVKEENNDKELIKTSTESEKQKSSTVTEDKYEDIYPEEIQCFDVKMRNYYHSEGTREICHDIKQSENKKLHENAVIKIAEYLISQNAADKDTILVPAPQHTGNAEYTKEIAKVISEKTGAKIADVLKCEPHKTLYEQKKSKEETELKLYLTQKLPEDKKILFVDNVVSTGKTFNEAESLIPGLKPLIYAASDHVEFEKINGRIYEVDNNEELTTKKMKQSVEKVIMQYGNTASSLEHRLTYNLNEKEKESIKQTGLKEAEKLRENGNVKSNVVTKAKGR